MIKTGIWTIGIAGIGLLLLEATIRGTNPVLINAGWVGCALLFAGLLYRLWRLPEPRDRWRHLLLIVSMLTLALLIHYWIWS